MQENAGKNGSALIREIKSCKLEAAALLIDKDADLNDRDETGYSALMLAVCCGYMDIIKRLIDKGADLELRESHGGWTALMLASRWGFTETARLLMDGGANIDAQDKNRKTALDLAKEAGNKTLVELIRKKKEDNLALKRIVVIEFEKDGTAWKLELKVQDIGRFRKFIQDESLQDKIGAELTAALMASDKKATVLSEASFYKNGRRNNGPAGEAAFLFFDTDGVLRTRAYYEGGWMNDTQAGEAACQHFDYEGKLREKMYFKNGKLNDTPDGAPAWQRFDGEKEIQTAKCFKDGKQTETLESKEKVAAYFATLKNNKKDNKKPVSPRPGAP